MPELVGTAAIDAWMRDTIEQQRFRTRLVALFALLAVIFAVTGVYGVISRSVARRTREMSIRMALGAEASRVITLVVMQGARLALLGLAIGLVAALFATRSITAFLLPVPRTDLLTYVAIAVGLGTMALLATLGPAWRGTRGPLATVRSE